MSQIVIFLPSDLVVPNRAKEYISSGNTPDYSSNPDALINPDLSTLLGTVPVKYWKRSGSFVVEMSPSEKTALDNAEAAASTLAIRTSSKSTLDGFSTNPLFQRALADIIKDEFNILRKWTRDFKVEVAAASSLADLKARIATLSTLNDRTLDQLKTAIKSRVDDGSVD